MNDTTPTPTPRTDELDQNLVDFDWDEGYGKLLEFARTLEIAGSAKVVDAVASGGQWTYSRYRATLKKDGKTFAIVSSDGRNALSASDTETLLRALNSEKVLDTVLHDVDYKGGLQDWIARYDALFLELCKTRGVIVASSPNHRQSATGTNERRPSP